MATSSSTPRTTAAKRSAAAQKAATTRKTNATKRSTTAKKAAATRRETTAAKQAAQAKQETKNSVKRAGVLAEKAVLVPVGAALVARDGVNELRSKYSTRNKTENELRRFERRGTSAVKGVERDLKKSRTKIERELRQRRTRIEREVKSMIKDIESRTEPVTKNVELVGARVESVVASGRNAAAKVSERITALA